MAARADLKTVISADMTGFSATMRKAGVLAKTTGGAIGRSIGSATKAMGSLVATAGKASLALGAVGAAVGGAAFVRGLKNAADLGGGLSDLSARTGILAGDLAVMQRAFEDNGVSADKIGGIVNKLQKTIGDAAGGSAKLVEVFDGIGISIDEITSLSPAKQFQAVQSAIAKIEDPTRRAHAAMQLFGRSGGELLTLFADGQAFSGAAKFLGTQAEILNRSSGVFDAISDKLARIPAKLQGFFVGFLEPIADDVDAILTKFDNFDFAALGRRLAEGIKLENVAPAFGALSEFMAAVIGEGLAKGVQVGGSILAAAFSVDGLAFIGDSIVTIFKNAFLEVGLLAVRAGVAIAQAMQGQIGIKDIPKAILGDSSSKKGPKGISEVIQDAIDNVDWAPSDNIKDAAKKFALTIKGLFPETSGGGGGEESSFGKAADGETYGFKGLENLYRMQRDMEGGTGPGSRTMLSASREQLGIGSGLSGGGMGRWAGRQGIADATVTGGLGERRRLRTSGDDKDAKKNLSLQEQQVEFLGGIESKIGQALSVN